MRQLRDDTHLVLDGEVRVYRRERSKRWQAAFVIDGHTIRISTGKRDLSEAKEYARDAFLEYKFRHKNDLPVVTKKFSDVARLTIADMRKQLDAGLGKKVSWELGGFDPALDHAALAVDQFKLGQPGQITDMIHALRGTDARELVVFAQEGRQAQGFEMVGQEQFWCIGHAPPPSSRLM